MKKNTHLRERGFTLIELMIVLGIGSLVFMNFIQMEQKRQESISAENAGGQLYEVGQALAQFINMNNSVLQTAVPQGTTTTTPIPLSAMQSSSGTTTIGGVAVPNRLLLPQTYDNRLGFPTVLPVTYSIYLRNNAGTVTGLIITNTGILDKSGATRYDWTGIAMKKAGAQAGVVFGSPTQINGLNGIWALTNSDYPAINTLGQVAYRVAYQATYDSTYLRLDGMYPMIGNLNMGNYSIKNATDISYTGWLYGNNAAMNNLLTGTITNAGNITTQSINGKSTALTSANAANYSNSVSPTASYANFDNFYANCINCGFPSDTGTANISTKFNAANGDVRIGADGNTGNLFVKDILLAGNGGFVVDSKNAFISDRLPRYADRGVAVVNDNSTLPKPTVTTSPTASGYVCRWTGQGNAPVPKIEVVPALQWIQGAVRGPIAISNAGSQLNSDNTLTLNTTITQNQYSLSSFQAYAIDSGSSWTIFARTPNYASATGDGSPYNSYTGGTALAHVYCDYGS